MKRLLSFLLVLSMVLCICPAVQANVGVMKEFYVDPVYGNDLASGEKAAPFLTVERAKTAVKEYLLKINGNMTGNIIVNLAEGRYELEKYLQFFKEESGTNGYKVIYQGTGAKKSVISGGTEIGGWNRQSNGLWTAYAPELEFARDLYVNERPAVRARTQNKIKGLANYLAPDSGYKYSDGFYVSSTQLKKLKNPKDVVIHWSVSWKDYQFAVRDILDDPKDNSRLIVKLENPIWDSFVMNMVGNERILPSYDKDFIVENALELLDEPGEFYFDKSEKMMYYYPFENEDMQNVKTIVPRLERLVRIDGNDYYHQASNIAFRDIGFAHATNPLGENSSYCNQQGEAPGYPKQAANVTPGAVEVSWTKNIEFSDCAFWGTELAGLSFGDGVSNGSVTGCSFTDIGSSAAIIGRAYHKVSSPPSDRKAAANVVFRKRWKSSANYVSGIGNVMTFFHGGSTGNEFDYRKGTDASGVNARTWRSQPWSQNQGTKPWVMFDLEKEYKLSSIRLSFEEDCAGTVVTEQEKNNFEVLLSNDESFLDYEVVKTFTNPAESVENISVSTNTPYRYLMIRKTVEEPLAIFGVWAYSYDREPLGMMDLCKNITFENNYVARAGRYHSQAPAVLVHFSERASIRHNEIVDSAYTGLSLGWDWLEDNSTAKYNVIENNLIDSFNLNTDDGGGIYILGRQRKLTISGNVVKNQGNMWAGIYFDIGSADIVAESNVVMNTANTLMFWNDLGAVAKGTVTVRNTYSDMSQVSRHSGNAYVDCEDVKVFTHDNIPEEAVAIMANAGLQENYRHLREAERAETPWQKGPEMAKVYHRTENASTRALAFECAGENILQNAQFGDLPWQYDYEDYFRIKKALDDIKNPSNRVSDYANGHILKEYALKAAVEASNKNIEHLTYDKMVELCEKKTSEAKSDGTLGSYPSAAVLSLNAALESEKAAQPSGEVERALAARRLERAVEAFEASQFSADLEYAYVEDGKTSVDEKNRTITITVPFDAELTALKPETIVSDGAELVTDLFLANFEKPLAVTVKNIALGLEELWTLEVVREKCFVEVNGDLSSNDGNWINNNPNSELPKKNGALRLQPSYNHYIYDRIIGNSAEWEIMTDALGTAVGGNHGEQAQENVAFGKTATANWHSAGTVPAAAIDGDVNTSFVSAQDPAVFCLDLGGTYSISKIVMKVPVASGYDFSRNVNIHLSQKPVTNGTVLPSEKITVLTTDSSGWKTKDKTTIDLAEPVNARYVIVEKPQRADTHDSLRISELEVYGLVVNDGVSLLFGGKRKNIDIGAKEENNSYYRLGLSENKASLYYADNGTETLFASNADVSFIRNGYNSIEAKQEQNTVDIYVNDVKVMSASLQNTANFKGYCGVYNPNSIVDLKSGYAEGLINAARNKPVFANSWMSPNDANRAVDENAESHYISDGGSSYGYRFIVDLEKAYPVQAIDYLPYGGTEYAKDLTFYLSNDPKFETKKVVYAQHNNEAFDNAQQVRIWTEDDEAYRYVMVEKAALTGNLAISELRVMVPEEYASELSNSSSVVCVSKEQLVKDSHANKIVTNLNSRKVDDAYGQASAADMEIYAFIDLGKAVPVSYITISSHIPLGVSSSDLGLYELYRKNFQLVATNDPDFKKSEDVVIAYEKESVSPDGLMVYPLGEFTGSYRYVGVRGLLVDESIPRLRLNQLDVYARTDDFSDCFLPITIEKNDNGLTAILKGVADKEEIYWFVAGYYDESGRMYYSEQKKLTSEEAETTSGNMGHTFSLPKKQGKVKIFVWKLKSNFAAAIDNVVIDF